MLSLDNETPFVVDMGMLTDANGRDTWVLCLKGTFAWVAGGVAVHPQQQPLVAHDAYWGDPATSALRYPADMGLCAPGSDVGVLGHVWAPGGKSVQRVQAMLRVGSRREHLHVSGDRVWERTVWGVQPSKAAPFARMPLRYERAFGGCQREADGAIACDDRNPIGQGFVGNLSPSACLGMPLPNLECPDTLLTRPSGELAQVAGFGFIAPHWAPRRTYAGTYDAPWRQKRAPFLPKDYQARYMQAAHPRWALPTPLLGGEEIEMHHLSPQAHLTFCLPRLAVSATFGDGAASPCDLRIARLLIEPDAQRFTLLWRAAIACDAPSSTGGRIRITAMDKATQRQVRP